MPGAINTASIIIGAVYANPFYSALVRVIRLSDQWVEAVNFDQPAGFGFCIPIDTFTKYYTLVTPSFHRSSL